MMNWNILIHALLLILIFHILIVHIESNREKYSEEERPKKVKKEKRVRFDKKESIDYLEESFQSKMDSEETVESFENKALINTITPANTFDKMDYVNHPNFESNVLNFNAFYKINNSKETREKNVPKNHLLQVSTPRESSPSVSPRPFPSADNGKIPSRPSRQLPDRWEYTNELPMNGGMFGSIVGLDSMEGLYSSYDGGAMSIKKCGQEVVADVPHNDLRKPIVYN